MGCTLAPTSMGIALNVLKQAKLLNTPTGQLIIAAAVLDDVIALLLLSELQALGNPTPVALMAPIAVSLGLMLFFGGVAVFVMPGLISFVMPRIPQQQQPYVLLGAVSSPTRHAHTHAPTHAHIHAHHHAHIHAHIHAHVHAHIHAPTHTHTHARPPPQAAAHRTAPPQVLCLAISLVPLCHTLGSSHLLGAFLAGFCFCTDDHVHKAWAKQVKRVLHWLLKISNPNPNPNPNPNR